MKSKLSLILTLLDMDCRYCPVVNFESCGEINRLNFLHRKRHKTSRQSVCLRI